MFRLIILVGLIFPAAVFAAPAGTEFAAVQSPAEGICEGEVCFAKKVTIDGKELVLRGAALFEYYNFDVYTGAFYAEPDVDTIDEALADRPKYLVLHYHRGLERQNFIDNSEHILQQNKDINRPALNAGFDQLYRLYSSVKEGDRYSLFYEPGKGTTLYLNGKAQGLIPGDDFQKANYGIWLSRYSVGREFTQKLLKGQAAK